MYWQYDSLKKMAEEGETERRLAREERERKEQEEKEKKEISAGVIVGQAAEKELVMRSRDELLAEIVKHAQSIQVLSEGLTDMGLLKVLIELRALDLSLLRIGKMRSMGNGESGGSEGLDGQSG